VRTVSVRVPAKINLALGVGGVREDGFHPLATVYQAVDLYDEVRATANDTGEVTVETTSDVPGAETEASLVPRGRDNLAVRAALALREQTGVEAGVDLVIRKAIPVAGGMAGGSADAAATLVACNDVWGLGWSRHELEPVAAGLGSDVPFLLHGGNAIGGGRGELVSPVLARGSYHWVVAVSGIGLSTASVYAEFDRLNADRELATPEVPDALLAALRSGDAVALGAALSNDLTEAALSLRPDLAQTLEVGVEAGALGALVSGSGPTCVFLAADEQQSLDIAIALAGAGRCADVVQSIGPVPGVRVV
jgi:4-diphosphocytidyl-2-C-methyl-D-erythritol kinase